MWLNVKEFENIYKTRMFLQVITSATYLWSSLVLLGPVNAHRTHVNLIYSIALSKCAHIVLFNSEGHCEKEFPVPHPIMRGAFCMGEDRPHLTAAAQFSPPEWRSLSYSCDTGASNPELLVVPMVKAAGKVFHSYVVFLFVQEEMRDFHHHRPLQQPVFFSSGAERRKLHL